MSSPPFRRRITTAATAVSVALLAAACTSTTKSSQQPATLPASGSTVPGSPSSAPTSTAPTIQWATGTPLISDGTTAVTIGGVAVTFPTTVTEATWSEDGSRIAFIAGDGTLSTARADGSSLVVLVKPPAGSKLSTPTWDGGTVVYTERTSAGKESLMVVSDQMSKSRPSADAYAESPDGYATLPDISRPSATEAGDIHGTTDTLLFQHKGAKGPEIWMHRNDSNARGGPNPAEKIADGSWPALGAGLAFVGTNGQIEVAQSAQDGTSQKPLQISSDATTPTHLVWAPDGKSIAFSTPSGIRSVPVGASPAPSTQLSDKPGVISFLPAATDQVVQIAGNDASDAVGAAIALSQDRWVTQTGTTPQPAGNGNTGPYAVNVEIVAADTPDEASKSLSWAIPADGFFRGPTLAFSGSTLDPRLTAELKRVLGTPVPAANRYGNTDSVFIAGGTDAIPSSLDAAIKALGYDPVRLSAPAKSPTASTSCTAVVGGADTAGLAAAKTGNCHIISVTGSSLAATDKTYLTSLASHSGAEAVDVIAVDGTADSALRAAATDSKLSALAVIDAAAPTGPDFEAAVARAALDRPYLPATAITVVPAGSTSDLLLAQAGGPGPIVGIDPAVGVSPTLKALLAERSPLISQIVVIDTGSKLGKDLITQLGTLISGPLGFASVANPQAK